MNANTNTTTPLPTAAALTPQEAFDRFSLIVNGPALFNAIVSGIDLSIFATLEQDPGLSLAVLADRTGIEPAKLRVLMFALCTTGLVGLSDGGYVNAELASQFLGHDGPDSWSHILLGWHRLYYPAFAHLTDSLQAGRNLALDAYAGQEETLYARLRHNPELEAILHRAMSAFTLQSLPGFLENVDLTDVSHLLDVGGGDGTTALALVERYPTLVVTILDVSSVAERSVASITHERIVFREGDVFSTEFPGKVDAVLFSHFLEVFSSEQIRVLLAKAFAALHPGGVTYVYGFNASPDETDGVYSARLALYLTALATGNGMTYPAADYEEWLRGAGFTDVCTVPGLDYEHGLNLGRKPWA